MAQEAADREIAEKIEAKRRIDSGEVEEELRQAKLADYIDSLEESIACNDIEYLEDLL
jgi:hypothetical protein